MQNLRAILDGNFATPDAVRFVTIDFLRSQRFWRDQYKRDQRTASKARDKPIPVN